MKRKLKCKFCQIEQFEYKGGRVFDAGFVKDSPHKEDDVYFQLAGIVFHLRDDEVHAIIAALAKTMWCLGIARLNKYSDFKFKTIKQMRQEWWSKKRRR